MSGIFGSARKGLFIFNAVVVRRGRCVCCLPAIVPPVPVENVTASTLPSVCCHISGPVVSKCALLLDILSN